MDYYQINRFSIDTLSNINQILFQQQKCLIDSNKNKNNVKLFQYLIWYI